MIRACPTLYQQPWHLARARNKIVAQTVYVVGGLYGNEFALRRILELRDSEVGPRPVLIFNGDFNWFNKSNDTFRAINETALAHLATAGNVEMELGDKRSNVGCGCNYPPHVSAETIQWADEIMTILQQTADGFPTIKTQLANLPRGVEVAVGGQAIAVIHGEPHNLAGWSLAAESMDPPDRALQATLLEGCADTGVQIPTTPARIIEEWLTACGVNGFACTHTCLAFAQRFAGGMVFNNGSAGMPNFADSRFGVITRISEDIYHTPAGSLYHAVNTVPDRAPVRWDAVAVHYDHDKWWRQFAKLWPRTSPAFSSYGTRIRKGVLGYTIEQASRIGTTLSKP